MPLVEVLPAGLYCPLGDFFIDPWQSVERAVITHAHADHARPGSSHYLTAAENVGLLRARLGEVQVSGLSWGESVSIGPVRVSLHPAGHILGSAQVRIEAAGEVWVISGDFKRDPDPTCRPFEPLRCHSLVSESTFALPIFRWPDLADVFEEIDQWWSTNQQRDRTSVLFGYALGKSERLLAGLLNVRGPIFVHGALLRFLPAYEAAGVRLPPVEHATAENVRAAKGQSLVLAPPSAIGSPWLRKFGPVSTGLASGWTRIRGTRRHKNIDRGFVLSDHAGWADLVATVRESQAEQVLLTHGFAGTFARWLVEQGYDARPLATPFEGEDFAEDDPDDAQQPA